MTLPLLSQPLLSQPFLISSSENITLYFLFPCPFCQQLPVSSPLFLFLLSNSKGSSLSSILEYLIEAMGNRVRVLLSEQEMSLCCSNFLRVGDFCYAAWPSRPSLIYLTLSHPFPKNNGSGSFTILSIRPITYKTCMPQWRSYVHYMFHSLLDSIYLRDFSGMIMTRQFGLLFYVSVRSGLATVS